MPFSFWKARHFDDAVLEEIHKNATLAIKVSSSKDIPREKIAMNFGWQWPGLYFLGFRLNPKGYGLLEAGWGSISCVALSILLIPQTLGALDSGRILICASSKKETSLVSCYFQGILTDTVSCFLGSCF